MIMQRVVSRFAIVSAVFVTATMTADLARAGDCNADIAGLSQKRQVFIDKLNVLAKAAKGKLDPVASCPHPCVCLVKDGGRPPEVS